MTRARRLLIVGGVAGGASAAARARRLDESWEIIVFDKGPHVSFANCGLPYYVGDVIRDERKLLVATPELFRRRFNIDVRVHSEVRSIDTDAHEIDVVDLINGRTYREPYDALVLSPGAQAMRPPVPGVDLPGIFVMRTIADSRSVREWIQQRETSHALVVGGSFIGLEMAENLAKRGLTVTVLELADQILPQLDIEMAKPVEEHLLRQGVNLRLGDAVARFEQGPDGGIVAHTQSGATISADLAVLGTGVRPEISLAERTGLALGEKGGIRVDQRMRTSVPGIWAVGDAVEVRETLTGIDAILPLAGPANRQGRIAANDICGRKTEFRGVQGTAVVGVFGVTVAVTGCNERALKRAGVTDYERVYLHPGHHASYYPGAKPIRMKLLFRPTDGRVLGAQAVGEEGAARRIDVISMAIQMGGTVGDLEEAELCYAPQFGAAKDPVNVAGMIASNAVRGDLPLARWEDIDRTDAVLLDVRTHREHAEYHVPGSINIPIDELRDRIEELPTDREIWAYCEVGQRSYFATRTLLQHGRAARNLPGGCSTYRGFLALRRGSSDG